MRQIVLPQIHQKIMDQSILLTGIFRSGTTILGKILGSAKNTEYAFEPPLAFHLDALLAEKQISTKLALELLQTYLSEHYLLQFLHGRGYNMRPGDDSSVFVMKSYDDVLSRWQDSGMQKDLLSQYSKQKPRLIFKLPATYALLFPYLERYPQAKVIYIKRDLRGVLQSVLTKGWFRRAHFYKSNYASIWPGIALSSNWQAPYYSLDPNYQWQKLSELERAMLVLTNLTENWLAIRKAALLVGHKSRIVELSYEQLVSQPNQQIRRVFQRLDLEFGSMTDQLLSSIKARKEPRQQKIDFSQVNKKLLHQFLSANKKLAYS